MRAFVDAVTEALGFGPQPRYDLKLAVNEAAANAIAHGSRAGEESIRVRAETDNGSLTFHVIDGGSFHAEVETHHELPERGRGLAFMATLTDQVCVSARRNGTLVRLSMHSAPVGEGEPEARAA